MTHLVARHEVGQEQGLTVDQDVAIAQGVDDVVDLGGIGAADAQEGALGELTVARHAAAGYRRHDGVVLQSELLDGGEYHLGDTVLEVQVAVEAKEHDVRHGFSSMVLMVWANRE